MTTAPTATPAVPAAPAPRGGSWIPLVWSVVAGLGILGVVFLLVYAPTLPPPPINPPQPTGDLVSPAQVVGSHRLTIAPDTSLFRKLSFATATVESLTTPALTVTGSVIACRDPGNARKPDEHWVFYTPELAALHSDWIKAAADVSYTKKQLDKTKELADTRNRYQRTVVDRLKKLVAAGTDSQKDLAAAEADLIQGQLQAQKDTFEAETGLLNAQRSQAALERQFFQAGLDPQLLEKPRVSTDIVMADVPEARYSLVTLGQKCVAKFYARPGESFPGTVASLSPILARDRRTLRVLFLIDDPNDLLKPGMFADVGLGTDPHDRLLVPADAVLHVGRSDYVFAAGTEANGWNVTEVNVGEAHGTRYEIIGGLKPGAKVITRGAILLKPLLLEALAR